MSTSPIIKTGFCVAYDWQLLKISLPIVYEASDVICLAIDKGRVAWSGEKYDFDSSAFYSFISQVDTKRKIVVYEDDFFDPNLDKRQNCNRHRTMLSQKLGKGGWHIQVDSDEYFLDFKGFVNYLKKIDRNPSPEQKPINVCCAFIPLFKKTSEGYLYVHFEKELPEMIPMATNVPDYQRARQNGHFNHLSPFYVVHETWARDEAELWFKINNWGHASEELAEKKSRLSYFNLWKAIDEHNFQYLKNFHAASPTAWPRLRYCRGKDITDFISQLMLESFPLNSIELSFKNSRNISRFRSLLDFVYIKKADQKA